MDNNQKNPTSQLVEHKPTNDEVLKKMKQKEQQQYQPRISTPSHTGKLNTGYGLSQFQIPLTTSKMFYPPNFTHIQTHLPKYQLKNILPKKELPQFFPINPYQLYPAPVNGFTPTNQNKLVKPCFTKKPARKPRRKNVKLFKREIAEKYLYYLNHNSFNIKNDGLREEYTKNLDVFWKIEGEENEKKLYFREKIDEQWKMVVPDENCQIKIVEAHVKVVGLNWKKVEYSIRTKTFEDEETKQKIIPSIFYSRQDGHRDICRKLCNALPSWKEREKEREEKKESPQKQRKTKGKYSDVIKERVDCSTQVKMCATIEPVGNRQVKIYETVAYSKYPNDDKVFNEGGNHGENGLGGIGYIEEVFSDGKFAIRTIAKGQSSKKKNSKIYRNEKNIEVYEEALHLKYLKK